VASHQQRFGIVFSIDGFYYLTATYGAS